jgi:AbrB family looped-hinge helix DNA binding protein
MAANKAMTTVSTKGQVILPKAIRAGIGWSAGQRLVVERTSEGVLLRAANPFPPSRPQDVFGSLKTDKRLSDEDIEKALRAAAKRRARD